MLISLLKPNDPNKPISPNILNVIYKSIIDSLRGTQFSGYLDCSIAELILKVLSAYASHRKLLHDYIVFEVDAEETESASSCEDTILTAISDFCQLVASSPVDSDNYKKLLITLSLSAEKLAELNVTIATVNVSKTIRKLRESDRASYEDMNAFLMALTKLIKHVLPLRIGNINIEEIMNAKNKKK